MASLRQTIIEKARENMPNAPALSQERPSIQDLILSGALSREGVSDIVCCRIRERLMQLSDGMRGENFIVRMGMAYDPSREATDITDPTFSMFPNREGFPSKLVDEMDSKARTAISAFKGRANIADDDLTLPRSFRDSGFGFTARTVDDLVDGLDYCLSVKTERQRKRVALREKNSGGQSQGAQR